MGLHCHGLSESQGFPLPAQRGCPRPDSARKASTYFQTGAGIYSGKGRFPTGVLLTTQAAPLTDMSTVAPSSGAARTTQPWLPARAPSEPGQRRGLWWLSPVPTRTRVRPPARPPARPVHGAEGCGTSDPRAHAPVCSQSDTTYRAAATFSRNNSL